MLKSDSHSLETNSKIHRLTFELILLFFHLYFIKGFCEKGHLFIKLKGHFVKSHINNKNTKRDDPEKNTQT